MFVCEQADNFEKYRCKREECRLIGRAKSDGLIACPTLVLRNRKVAGGPWSEKARRWLDFRSADATAAPILYRITNESYEVWMRTATKKKNKERRRWKKTNLVGRWCTRSVARIQMAHFPLSKLFAFFQIVQEDFADPCRDLWQFGFAFLSITWKINRIIDPFQLFVVSVSYFDLGIISRWLVILSIDSVSTIVLPVVVIVHIRNGNSFRRFRPAAATFRIRVWIRRCREVVALNTRWITGSWPGTECVRIGFKIENSARTSRNLPVGIGEMSQLDGFFVIHMRRFRTRCLPFHLVQHCFHAGFVVQPVRQAASLIAVKTTDWNKNPKPENADFSFASRTISIKSHFGVGGSVAIWAAGHKDQSVFANSPSSALPSSNCTCTTA